MKQYRLEITENKTVLEDFDTYEDAMSRLKDYESKDKENECYEIGYYTVSRLNGDYYEGIYDSKHGFYGDDEQ